LENLAAVVSVLQRWLDQWAAFLTHLPEQFALALLVIPIALAIVSRHWAMAVGCTVLVLIGYLVFISPSNTAVIIGTGVYIGSLVMALSTILARRKEKNFRAEVALLQSQVKDLLAAEHRRLLRDIRSSAKEGFGSGPKPAPKSRAE
jgi:hypothetical protein